MTASDRKTTRLRAIFESPQTTVMPFGVLPIHAQMAQHAGYQAFELSGGNSAWWAFGMPDAGFLTQTEVVAFASHVARSVEIPVYCDADTGYGSALNTWRTTQQFIHGGVAGIHIEDQREPKMAGGQAGVKLVSDEEAIGRLRAAIDARNELDPDFVIVARTDAYGAEGGGIAEALRRGNLYKKEADADVIFYEGIRSWDEVRYLLKNTEGPAYAIASKTARPTPSLAELTEMGQRISILRFTQPGVQEVWNLLLESKKRGDFSAVDEYTEAMEANRGTPQWVGHGEIFASPTLARVREMEAKYLPSELRRDYEATPGDPYAEQR